MRAISVNRIRPAVKNHIFLHTLSSSSQKFSSDFKELLSDRSLANDITDRMWESDEWKQGLEALRKHGQKLIALIEGQLK